MDVITNCFFTVKLSILCELHSLGSWQSSVICPPWWHWRCIYIYIWMVLMVLTIYAGTVLWSTHAWITDRNEDCVWSYSVSMQHMHPNVCNHGSGKRERKWAQVCCYASCGSGLKFGLAILSWGGSLCSIQQVSLWRAPQPYMRSQTPCILCILFWKTAMCYKCIPLRTGYIQLFGSLHHHLPQHCNICPQCGNLMQHTILNDVHEHIKNVSWGP